MYQTYEIECQISGTTGTATSPIAYKGLLTDIRVKVLTSGKSAASSNTVTVALAESTGFDVDTLFSKTGITGIGNRYAPRAQMVDNTGAATGLYTTYAFDGFMKLSCTNGTATDWVLVAFTLIV